MLPKTENYLVLYTIDGREKHSSVSVNESSSQAETLISIRKALKEQVGPDAEFVTVLVRGDGIQARHDYPV